MIYILNNNEKIIGLIQHNIDKNCKNIYFDDLLQEDLQSGAEALTFSAILENDITNEVSVGNYIAFKKADEYKLMQIIEVEEEKIENRIIKNVYCESAGLELTNEVYTGFDMESVNFKMFLENILQDTFWQVGNIDVNLVKNLYVKMENKSIYSLIQEYSKIFGAEIAFRVDIKNNKVVGRYIDAYVQRGKDVGKRLEVNKDIKNITRKMHLMNYATKLIGRGKDGLTFKDISDDSIDKPLGQDFIINNDAFFILNYKGKHITKIFEYDTTDPRELLLQTKKALDEYSKIKVEYNIDSNIIDLTDIEIGDTIYISDLTFNPPLLVSARVHNLETSKTNDSNNKITLSNYKEIKSYISKFPIGSNDILDEAITNDKIDKNYTNTITTDILKDSETFTKKLVAENATIINAEITNLKAQNVTITGKLTAVEGEFGKLKANVATIEELTVTHTATINELKANKADITQLEAVSATIGTLEVQVGKIETLVNGNLTSENIHSLHLTSASVTVENGFIKSAMIESLDVSKVNAGDISTNKFRIVSNSGKMLIADNTIQIKDNNRVRVQIGKDASNDYNMYVWDINGNLMFDATGLKEDGIKNKIIRDDMISDNANIDGTKINISSLITEINQDTNTTVIKSSKVQLDTVGQTLDVAFNSLKSNIDNMEIGVENLFLNADFRKGKNNWYGSHGASIEVIDNPTSENLPIPAKKVMKLTGATGQNYSFINQSINCELDTEYTVSFWCYFSDTIPEDLARIMVYYNNSGWKEISGKKIIERNKWIKKSLTFKSDKTFNNLILALGFRGSATPNKVCYCCLAKVEKGNKATDFTLASADIDSTIESVKQITESNSTTIGVMQGQISTAINNTQIVKDGQTILLKDDYNRTVATIDSMKSTIGSHTSQINGLNSKVNTQGSSIEQLKGQISLKVEQTDINTAINNIEIGVRNYILNSAIKNNTNNFTLKVGVTRNTENLTPNSNNSFYINASNLTSNEWRGVSQIRSGILKIGNVYTISCNIFIPTNHGIDEGCAFEIICWNSSGSRTGTYAVSANRKILDKWQKLKRTFTVPNDTVKFTLQAYVTRNGKFYTGDFSLVQGEKDNWSNAPEDTDKKIDNALLKHMGINLIVNQGTFAPNQPDKDGEFYIHGFDSDGNKADVDGYIINPNTGEKINIAKTMINPNTKLPFNQEVYLCYSNRFWFAWYSTSDKRWKTIDANGNTHQSTAYDLNWNDSQLVLGVVVMSSAEMCASGFLYDKPKNYRDAIGQTIEFTTTKSKVAILETNLNSITSRVSSVETKTTKIDGKVTSLETWKKSAEQKITDSAIISTVSSQFYKKGETDSKYASQTQITQLSNQISSKVDVNGVISTIKQNPSAISVGFNGIDNRIQMTSDGMFFNNVSGKRTLSLKRGYLHLYNPLDSTLMGASIARSTQGGQYYDNGISTVVSNNGYYYSIAKASDWNNDTQATFNPKEYFIINFRDRGSANINKKGIHALDVLFPSAGINMLNASITGANTITANNLSAISFRHPNGNQLFRSDGYNIYNDRNWDWQRRNILDPIIIGGSYGYSASLNVTRQRKTSIDTSSILDCINIIEPINTYSKSSNSSLEMDISQLINHPNAHMFIDIKTNNIDMKSMLHLALLEIQKLKKEIQEIRAS